MRFSVNATRMELHRLKKRLILARRGHKLLKDKQDELMRQFMDLVNALKGLRRKVEDHLHQALQSFTFARATMSPEAMEEALCFPSKSVRLSVAQKQVMNVRVPVLVPTVTGKMQSYGFATTSGDLDVSLRALEGVLKEMLELAQAEKTLELLADEIEKTRRRVNALEYVLIPNLIETIKYIDMKLAEMERSNLTRLMKIKDIIRGG